MISDVGWLACRIVRQNTHHCGYLVSHGFGCRLQWVIVKMRVSLCRGTVCVSEKCANDWKACATRNPDAGEAVVKIMQPDIIENCHAPDNAPHLRGAFIVAFAAMRRKYKGRAIKPGYLVQDFQRTGIERDSFLALLRIG